MEKQSLQDELDEILSDLNRINLMVSKKEQDLARAKNLYVKQEGSESFSLHIDQNIFYVTKQELQKLAKQLLDLNI